MKLTSALSGAGLVVCVTIGQGNLRAQQPVMVEQVVAIVGDELITSTDIQGAPGAANNISPGESACTQMQTILREKLLAVHAKETGIEISPEELDAAINRRIAWFEQQLGGRRALEEYAGKTIYELREDTRGAIEQQMLADAARRQLLQGVSLTPTEVKAYWERYGRSDQTLLEAEWELGQIVHYPRPSADLTEYVVNDMNRLLGLLKEGKIHPDQLERQMPGTQASRQWITTQDQIDGLKLGTVAFRLKQTEFSQPLTGRSGSVYLIQLLEKTGTEAEIMLWQRKIAADSAANHATKERLGEIRSRLASGKLNFDEAAQQFSEDRAAAFSGHYLQNAAGSIVLRPSDLDAETAQLLSGMQAGGYSVPVQFKLPDGSRAWRILYMHAYRPAHRMNWEADYARIAARALEARQEEQLSDWLRRKMADKAVEWLHQDLAKCFK